MSDGAPSISVMIPARNEAAVIAEAVRKVLRQTYHRFEFLLLDDHSDDGTAAVAQESAGSDSRFHILDGSSIPPGWERIGLANSWPHVQRGRLLSSSMPTYIGSRTLWLHYYANWNRAAQTCSQSGRPSTQ